MNLTMWHELRAHCACVSVYCDTDCTVSSADHQLSRRPCLLLLKRFRSMRKVNASTAAPVAEFFTSTGLNIDRGRPIKLSGRLLRS